MLLWLGDVKMPTKSLLQGLIIIIIGVFFLTLSSLLYHFNYIKSTNRLIIFDVLSIVLVVLGLVFVLLSGRRPEKTRPF